MKIIITGGLCFVGSHLAEQLFQKHVGKQPLILAQDDQRQDG